MKKSNKFDIREKTLLYDNVLVKALDMHDEDSPFKDPRSYEDKPEVGEVIKIGQGRIFDNGVVVPLVIKVGEQVLFNKYTSTKFHFDGQDYYTVREEDILAH